MSARVRHDEAAKAKAEELNLCQLWCDKCDCELVGSAPCYSKQLDEETYDLCLGCYYKLDPSDREPLLKRHNGDPVPASGQSVAGYGSLRLWLAGYDTLRLWLASCGSPSLTDCLSLAVSGAICSTISEGIDLGNTSETQPTQTLLAEHELAHDFSNCDGVTQELQRRNSEGDHHTITRLPHAALSLSPLSPLSHADSLSHGALSHGALSHVGSSLSISYDTFTPLTATALTRILCCCCFVGRIRC